MPGGSLPGVSQQFGADASGYLAEVGKVVAANRELVASTREVERALGEIAALRGGASGVTGGGQDVAAEFRRQMDAIRGTAQAMGEARAAQAGFNASQAVGLAVARDHAAAMAASAQAQQQLTTVTRDGAYSVEALTRAHSSLLGIYQRQGLATDGLTAAYARAIEAQGGMLQANTSLADQMRSDGTLVRAFGSDVADLGARADSTAASARNAAAAIEAVHAAAAGAGAAGPGGSLTDIGRKLDQIGLGAGYANYRDLYRASYGGSAAAAAGALLGSSGSGSSAGSGSGGGDGGSFLGGFFGAMRPSNIFGGALDTVKMAHMITMFTMESLSTILPAAVAAGAAGAVGLQGGTNLYTTGTSLYNATEALGGAYGKTFGSYLGLGSGFQADQNMANGGVYGIAGGVLNLAGQGKNAFGSMGTQTIAMIDRGIASMVLNDRMGTVASALSGGTQDLRSFGDVGANIGDTLLNLAPALPGLGPDLLGVLKGVTGAASYVTGHVPTPILGGALAAEAGYRWGDLALAGGKMPWFLGGKTVGGLSGLAERMGLGTTAAEGLTAEDIASAGGMGIDLTGLGGAGAAEGTGLAGFLAGGAAGLPIGALTGGVALSAFLGSKLISSMPTPAQRQVGAWQGAINQSFGANAWTPLKKALYGAAQGQAASSTDTLANTLNQSMRGAAPIVAARFGPIGPGSEASIYGNAMTSFSTQMAQLIKAGPQAVKALQDMGYKGESVSQALTMMTDAMVSPAMIGPGGKISPKGVQMMKQFMTTYAPMTGTGPGAIIGAASAQDIMSYSGMKSLQTLNSAMDSVSQIIMGGASGAATQAAAGQGLAAAVTPGKGQPVSAAIAQALRASPFSTAGSSAWAAFTTGTSTAPGAISTLESEGDQLRTYLTLGALNSGQAGQLGAYEARQFLPDVQGSPMAMAMLAQQAVASGVPGAAYYNSKLSPAQNYASLQKALTQHGVSGQHAAALLAQGTIKTADLPALAASLITSQSGASPLDTAEVTQAGQQALAVQQAVATGKPMGGSLSGLVATLMAGGAKSSGAVGAGLRSILGQEGIGGSKLGILVQHGEVIYQAEYDRTNPPKPADQYYNVKGQLEKPTVPHVGDQIFNFRSHVEPPKVPPAPDGGTVRYGSRVAPPKAPPAPPGGTVVYHSIVIGPGGTSGQASVIGGGGARFMAQHGFKVPGYGGGDIHPALLEPGELVVPKDMVRAGAVDHLRGRIPGFQAGGFVGGDITLGEFVQDLGDVEKTLLDAISSVSSAVGTVSSQVSTYGTGYGRFGGGLTGTAAPKGTPGSPIAVELAGGSIGAGGMAPGIPAGATGALPIPAAAQKVVDAFEKTFQGMGNPWGGFASEIMQGLLDSIKDASKETSAQAKALTAKVTTEVNYAKNVASAATQGQGYGSAGLLGTFGNLATPTTTGTGQPYQYYTDQQNAAAGGTLSVQQQMSDYLQAEKSFTADLGKLSKGGLNKSLQQQLLAAGPLQGDQMAQSILGGAGGVGGANSLWKQIGAASNALGIGGAEGVYGYGGVGAAGGKSVKVGVTADTASVQSQIDAIHGKSVEVTVHLNIAGGGSGGGSGGVELTPAQVKSITASVQTALLKQAKRTGRTGIQLPGYKV